MTDHLIRIALGGHRVLLVFATVVVAVGTSRIANDPSDIPDWFIVGGSSLLLYAADATRGAEETAQGLSKAAKQPLSKTRRDVVKGKFPHGALFYWLGCGLILVLTGLALNVWLPGGNEYDYSPQRVRGPYHAPAQQSTMSPL